VRCGGTEKGGGLWKEWIRSVYGRQVDEKAQQHGTPWTGASGIMLDSGEGLVDARTRDSNQQHQEVNSTQDRGTGSTSEESSTNGGY
jgi:hypothetical protein